MKRCFFTLSIITFFILSFNTIEAQNHVPIDKGIIKGNFDIIFIDKNITLKSGEEFSLSKLGIESNAKKVFVGEINGGLVPNLTDIITKGKDRSEKYKYYNVKIHSNYTGKDYYGIILFCNTNKKNKNEAVCQSYEVNIKDSYFSEAESDNTASSYEYIDGDSSYSGFFNVITWGIIFRNKPLTE